MEGFVVRVAQTAHVLEVGGHDVVGGGVRVGVQISPPGLNVRSVPIIVDTNLRVLKGNSNSLESDRVYRVQLFGVGLLKVFRFYGRYVGPRAVR